MNSDLKSILLLLIGASLPLIGQFCIEFFKRKGERLKFSFEKIINVGEEYYKNSGMALLRFEASLLFLENFRNYNSPEAIGVFADLEKKLVEYNDHIASATVTISAANIYYDVSNVDVASTALASISKAMAVFHDIPKDNIER